MSRPEKARSQSSVVLAHLRTCAAGYEFTASQIVAGAATDDFPLTLGATSGFLHKATEAGMLEKVGRRDGTLVYRLLDPSADVRHRETRGAGSFPGASRGGPRGRYPRLENGVTRASVVDALFAVIERLESMPAELSAATDEQLTAELTRRLSAGKREVAK